ncbi:uncharacterized protein ASPGLDRAFT_655991 [Aspergillus glaucus CBS 516.65]|uniref:C3H1-type domain-containing protein n=1 Tax=Aspergillus glaucus CBS 516.65 TaxID=1160497 RepID=A0A1L9VBL5_ASPGL|nr:hypothetical protein ASPGLDRAFT_655991 [Aspergillus glaucus CBS 516.65]OJJ81316.1 hypothetical protein ASPGLDRAFT_655991 [Aspergillus glaucus CBS 516.65]
MEENHHREIISRYHARQAMIPCKHFTGSLGDWEVNGRKESFLFCPRGNHCHFRHEIPGQPDGLNYRGHGSRL